MASRGKGAVSKWWWVVAVLVALPAVPAIVFINSDMYEDMQYMKTPKFEIGEHRGAALCGSCHRRIYAEWRDHSRHAVATTNANFLDTRNYVEDNLFLKAFMGEESCYACHGIKGGAEGVNCEICHGPAVPGLSLEELHSTKYKPGLSEMRKKTFCANCHELFPPMMSPYSQWLQSKAASEGMTCQGCHMAPVDGIPYHGFDSILHNAGIYEGDLVIRDVRLAFPNLSMVVENRIKSHGVPVGGPSRVLVLEASILDGQGRQIHKVMDTFYRKFELMPEIMGSMPSGVVIEDTQLRSLEARPVTYALPAKIEGKARKVAVILRFYDVADQHQGNLEKAHWMSGPLARAELEIR